MSQTPDTPETGREHLRRALHHLPTHEPEATAWPRILAQLTADEAVARALPHLPTHEPDAALWNAITARLDTPEETPVFRAPDTAPESRPLWPAATLRLLSGVAAALVLVLAAWLLRPAHTPEALPGTMAATETASMPHETIAYSEEVVAAPAASPAAPVPFDPLGEQGLAFIDAHCTSLPSVCQSDEFQQLRSQLTELETEEQTLRQDARRFGSTPELVQHQVRITTLKATVTRELIQLLIS